MISSRSHPLVKHLRQVRDGQDKEFLFAEGPKLAEEVLRSKLPVRLVACTEDFSLGAHKNLLERFSALGAKRVIVSQGLLEVVSDLQSPPGVIVLARRPSLSQDLSIPKSGLQLILEGLQNPSNVGAVLRLAEAAGVRGVWILSGNADPFSPKVLRGSSGSALRLPLVSGVSPVDLQRRLALSGTSLVCAVPRGGVSYVDFDWKKSWAIILGNEASGVTPLWAKAARVSIPMQGEAESLNVAVAAGILLFEAKRQRNEFRA